MRVELDLFSGRPNPSWELDEAGVRELERLCLRLSPGGALPEPPALGYRGFFWRGAGGAHRAYRGLIVTPPTALVDPTCSVERFLLSQLPKPFSPLRQRVSAEIGRR